MLRERRRSPKSLSESPPHENEELELVEKSKKIIQNENDTSINPKYKLSKSSSNEKNVHSFSLTSIIF